MREFVRQAGEIQNVKVVFATRPFDDPSVEQELDRHLTRYALQPLTIQRIVKFVERICTNVNITNKLRSDYKNRTYSSHCLEAQFQQFFSGESCQPTRRNFHPVCLSCIQNI